MNDTGLIVREILNQIRGGINLFNEEQKQHIAHMPKEITMEIYDPHTFSTITMTINVDNWVPRPHFKDMK